MRMGLHKRSISTPAEGRKPVCRQWSCVFLQRDGTPQIPYPEGKHVGVVAPVAVLHPMCISEVESECMITVSPRYNERAYSEYLGLTN